ncbi:ATP-binding protein [Chitinophaga sp. MM2321]|uniref:sensor histidine kinase n=1 Tax=Chitinophaga sp. MM2321 TaxID=3137178 RepID=UPI0032D5A787
MKSPFITVTIVLLCLCSLTGKATDSLTYSLRHFDNSNGLPQNSVNTIVHDKYGYIWLTTENGIVRFDGDQFKVADIRNLSLKSNRFYTIFQDTLGNVGALNEKDEAVHIVEGVAMRYRFHSNERRHYQKWYQPGMKNHHGTSYALSLPNESTRWGARIHELKLYRDERSFYLYHNDTVSYVRDGVVRNTLPFPVDKCWNFFMLDGRFFHLESDGEVTEFSKQIKRSTLKGDILSDPFYRHSGRQVVPFWSIYDTSHLLVYFNHTFYLVTRNSNDELVTRKLVDNFDITGKEIRCAFYSAKDGRLLLGSATNGLFVLSLQQFVAKYGGEGSASYYSQMPYGQDGILIPNGYILKPKGAAIPLPPFRRQNISGFYSISTDGNGGSWTSRGIWLYHLQLSTFRLLSTDTLPSSVSMLYRDDKGLLWIGLKESKGIAVLDDNRKDAVPVLLHAFKGEITYFAKLNSRQMCVGTDEGLFLLNPLNGSIDTIKGLEGKYIRSITVTGSEEIWATTYDHGFYLYHKGKLTHFPYDPDGYITTAHCMVPDRKGFFWITTNRGLFQVSKKDLLAYSENGTFPLYYQYYDKEDGFFTNEFNGGCQPCAVSLNNGYISLPSLKGMVFFNPDSIKPILPEAAMTIDQLLLDNSPLPVKNKVKLPREFSLLQVMYSSPYFGNSKNLIVTYALVKNAGDTTWLPLPAEGKVSISTLPAGDYSLVVRKLNGFGYGNFSDKVLQFAVPLAWHETRWFYVTCALLLLILSWLFVHLRVRYLQNKALLLDMMVDLKTKELKKRTMFQQRIVQSVSHNVLSPLQYQQFLSEKILTAAKKDGGATVKMASAMNEHTSYLFYMVSNLLKYLKSQVEMGPVSGVYSPAAVAEDIQKIFLAIASEKNTEILNNIPDWLMLWGDEQLLSVMLYNLVDNAVKVTRKGVIVMEMIMEDDLLLLRVRDTGPGVPEDVKHWFNKPGSEAGPRKGSGIGLLIVKELAVAQGLKITLDSSEGEGSSFTIVSFRRHA